MLGVQQIAEEARRPPGPKGMLIKGKKSHKFKKY
jgi:hypothetical protein